MNLSTQEIEIDEDPAQIVLLSDTNQNLPFSMSNKSKYPIAINNMIKGPNGGMIRQNSETEYLIDPESSVGMLILKPTHQYSSNITTSGNVTNNPTSPMQIHDYQVVNSSNGQTKKQIVSGFY